MKSFKTIFYSCIALIAALFFIFSCINVSGIGQTSKIDIDDAVAHVEKMLGYNAPFFGGEHEARRGYIQSVLARPEYLGTESEEGYTNNTESDKIMYQTTQDRIPADKAAYLFMDYPLTSSDIKKYNESYYGEAAETDFMEAYVHNVIVYLPASQNPKTSDVILMTANFDSNPNSPGANSNLSSVAAMLETIRSIVNSQQYKSKSYKNNFMFVFTDAGEYGSLGAYALKERFIGFSNAYSRVKLAVNFQSKGDSGAVMLYQTSSDNAKLVSEWTKASKSVMSGSLTEVLFENEKSDFTTFRVPSLNFANIGGSEVHNTQIDNTVNPDIIKAHANSMLGIVDYFGKSFDLNTLTAEGDAVYFSLFNSVHISYPVVVAYILAAALIIILAAAIVTGILNKSINFKRVLFGAIIQLLAVGFAIGMIYAVYYLIGAILSIFGVFNIMALPTLTLSSMPLAIFTGCLAVSFAIAAYVILKKIFVVKAGDIVRANALILSLLAIIFSFALPSVSYLLIYPAILVSAVLLLTALFKDSFRDKFGMDMDRLFLFIVPIVLTLPLVLPAYFVLCETFGLSAYALLTMIPVTMAGFIAPYFDYLKPSLDKLFKKLPAPSLRVKYTEVERVEDAAKKGKFTTKEVVKIKREKQVNTYRNRYGITALIAICTVLMFVFSAIGTTYSRNVSGNPFSMPEYADDALIYVVDSTQTPYSNYWMVQDLDAYSYISAAVLDLEWNSQVNGYIKQDFDRISIDKATSATPTINSVSRTTDMLKFTLDLKHDMFYSITFSTIANLESISIYNVNDNRNREHSLTYNLSDAGSVTLNSSGTYTISNLRDDAVIEIKSKTGYGVYSGKMVFNSASTKRLTSTASDETLLNGMPEWSALKEHYANNDDVLSRLKASIKITSQFDLSSI